MLVFSPTVDNSVIYSVPLLGDGKIVSKWTRQDPYRALPPGVWYQLVMARSHPLWVSILVDWNLCHARYWLLNILTIIHAPHVNAQYDASELFLINGFISFWSHLHVSSGRLKRFSFLKSFFNVSFKSYLSNVIPNHFFSHHHFKNTLADRAAAVREICSTFCLLKFILCFSFINILYASRQFCAP